MRDDDTDAAIYGNHCLFINTNQYKGLLVFMESKYEVIDIPTIPIDELSVSVALTVSKI